jgi:hypothetical protein
LLWPWTMDTAMVDFICPLILWLFFNPLSLFNFPPFWLCGWNWKQPNSSVVLSYLL